MTYMVILTHNIHDKYRFILIHAKNLKDLQNKIKKNYINETLLAWRKI